MSTQFYKIFLNLALSQVNKDFDIITKAHTAYTINQWRYTTDRLSRIFAPMNHFKKKKRKIARSSLIIQRSSHTRKTKALLWLSKAHPGK